MREQRDPRTMTVLNPDLPSAGVSTSGSSRTSAGGFIFKANTMKIWFAVCSLICLLFWLAFISFQLMMINELLGKIWLVLKYGM